MDPEIFQKTISHQDPSLICDALESLSGLSKTKIKNAMNKGAVWIQRPRGKKLRIRRATAKVHPGDRVWLYYDPAILMRQAGQAHCLRDHLDYSIWYKPPGLMSQGSRFGDHCALTRLAEAQFHPRRPVYLIHRLDREVGGLIVLAHHRVAAARISGLMRNQKIKKKYQAGLKGDLRKRSTEGAIDLPLDSREACTTYQVLKYDQVQDITTVRIEIQTGRRHQIRRHFDLIGFPVMGDPRYGRNNRFAAGIQLVAYAIAFECPFSGKEIRVEIDPNQLDLGSVIL